MFRTERRAWRAGIFPLTMLLSAASVAGVALADGLEWPRFRGPQGSGVGTGTMPSVFGPGTNELWRAVPPPGHSSPSISGGRLFLTGHRDGKLLTVAFDRASGRELWRRELPAGPIERGASLGSPATATAATDGERVYVYFGSFGLAAYTVDGNEVWRKALPVPVTQHGAGTSPVVAGRLLLLNCDQDVGSYLLAVDARTGETAWKVERDGFRRGFGTPLPLPADQPEQVVVGGTLRMVSYNLKDGTERWSVRGLPNEMVSSPVEHKGQVVVAGWTAGSGVSRMPGFDGLLELGDANHDGKLTREEAPPGPAKQHFPYIDADKDGLLTRGEYETIARIFDESRNVGLAVRTDGRGDVTETHVAWRVTRGLPYVPSPLAYEGRVFLVRNGGLASCFDAATGRIHYQEERLGALGDYYASPVAAGGMVCMISQPGTAVVLRASDTLDIVSRNPLGEPVLATPALVDGVLYVRTTGTLYAFGTRR